MSSFFGGVVVMNWKKTLFVVSEVLLVIGGVNWGLGVFDFNLVTTIFKSWFKWIYGLVGLAGVYYVYYLLTKKK